MRLDYSIPSFSFAIGSFNASDYLLELSMSQPLHEIGQALTWNGSFKVAYNRGALRDGLVEGDFDQFLNPGRWRPAQHPVLIEIGGYPLPVMRIDRYAYNYDTQVGEGSLVQILDVVSGDRPPARQTGIFTSTSKIDIEWSVTGAVDYLLHKAFIGAAHIPNFYFLPAGGLVYDELLSNDPVPDAMRLLGSNWQWLTVDINEDVRAIQPFPHLATPLFARNLRQYDITPDTQQLQSTVSSVLVTGSFQRRKKRECDVSPQPIDPNLDRKARPKIQKTAEQKPFKEMFGEGSLNLTTSEIKTIYYQYPDDQNWESSLWGYLSVSMAYDVQTDYPIEGAPLDLPCQTVVVREQPAGRVFPELGTNTSLIVAEITIQSERRRATYVPAGVVDPSLGTDTSLVATTYEVLTTKPVIPDKVNHAGEADPKTGQAQCLEPTPKKEERIPLAEIPLETIACRGEASISYVGWTPFCAKTKVVEVGYCPDNAAFLAQMIAKREVWRQDVAKVEMPIPFEWLAAGCPSLPRVRLQDGDFLADGLILQMAGTPEGYKASFAFSAARITKTGVPLYFERLERKLGVKARIISSIASQLPYSLGVRPAIATRVIDGVFFESLGFKAQILSEVVSPPEIPADRLGIQPGIRSAVVAPAPDSLIPLGVMLRILSTVNTVVTTILDALAASTSGAYGLRLLRNGHTGYCLRVRRSSDSATLDVGFVGQALDTTALLAFVGSGDGFVTIWYDQSGNGRDITQTNPAIQPRIVIAGVLQTKNGVPVINQTTSQGMSIPAAALPGGSTWTINYVAAMVAGGNKQRILSGGTTNNWLLGWWVGEQRCVYTITGGAFSSGIAADNTVQIYTAIGGGSPSTNVTLTRNTTDWTSAGAAPSNSPTAGSQNFYTNGHVWGEPSDCVIAEVILFPTSISGADASTLEADQMPYFGAVV